MSIRRIRILLFWALIPLFALGVFFLIYGTWTPDVPNIEISTFGHRESIFLTEKMLNYQIGVQQAYQDADETQANLLTSQVDRLRAAVELMRFMLEKEVAENNGVKAAKKEIKEFSEYADKYSKAPEILEGVKEVFGDDRKSYENLYLAPKIINQKMAAFYSRNTEFHKEEREKIENAYGLALSPTYAYVGGETGEDFKKIAEQIGGHSAEFEIKEGFIEAPENFLLPIVKTLSSGQIYSNIVENDQSFMVVKLINIRTSDVLNIENDNSGTSDVKKFSGSPASEISYKIAAIVVDKKPFDDWFKKEAEKVEIKILDEDLKNSICAEYSEVWWLTKPCYTP